MIKLFGRPKCDDCGKFAALCGGASTADIYDFSPGNMGLDHERVRCAKCTVRLGPAKSNARPSNGDMKPYQTIHD